MSKPAEAENMKSVGVDSPAGGPLANSGLKSCFYLSCNIIEILQNCCQH